MTNNKQTTKDNTFYLVDLTDWVYGTIEKVEKDGKKWNDAWWDTYKTDLEGTSEDSGKKGCLIFLQKTGHLKKSYSPSVI